MWVGGSSHLERLPQSSSPDRRQPHRTGLLVEFLLDKVTEVIIAVASLVS